MVKIAAIVLLLVIAIDCGYIQYGFGKFHFEHPRCDAHEDE